MNNVILLSDYRNKRRRLYLARVTARLDAFIENFIHTHIRVDFESVSAEYQAMQWENAEQAWDYINFRDVLLEALEQAIGANLNAELTQQDWFDSRYMTRAEILERCLSAFVMGRTEANEESV